MGSKIRPCGAREAQWIPSAAAGDPYIARMSAEEIAEEIGGAEGICIFRPKRGAADLRLSPSAMGQVGAAIRMRRHGLDFPSWGIEGVQGKIRKYLDDLPRLFTGAPSPDDPSQSTPWPDAGRDILTGIPLGNVEVAVIRAIISDGMDPRESAFKRIQSYIADGPDGDGIAYYAISIRRLVDLGVQYEHLDQIATTFRQLLPDTPEAAIAERRIALLEREIEGWKKVFRDKTELDGATVVRSKVKIPDSVLAHRGTSVEEARGEIARYEGHYRKLGLPVRRPGDFERLGVEGPVIVRMALYPSEVAYFGWAIGDGKGEAFTREGETFIKGDETFTTEGGGIFIDRSADWKKLVAAAVKLENAYSGDPASIGMYAAAQRIRQEMERLKGQVEDESYLHHMLWDSAWVPVLVTLGAAGGALRIGWGLHKRGKEKKREDDGKDGPASAGGAAAGDRGAVAAQGEAAGGGELAERAIEFGAGVLLLFMTMSGAAALRAAQPGPARLAPQPTAIGAVPQQTIYY